MGQYFREDGLILVEAFLSGIVNKFTIGYGYRSPRAPKQCANLRHSFSADRVIEPEASAWVGLTGTVWSHWGFSLNVLQDLAALAPGNLVVQGKFVAVAGRVFFQLGNASL